MTPVTTSTPPAGSMSVVGGSTVCVLSRVMNSVFGTVIGRVEASAGADTSMRTKPVAVCVPSVTVNSM